LPAIDCGDKVAVWLSRFIFKQETGARLVYYPSSRTSRQIKTKDIFPLMKTTDGVQQPINFWTLTVSFFSFSIQAVFHDLAPYLVLSEASVSDLNANLDADSQVSTLNFRPNIVVSGCPAFAEDSWNFIKIGDDAVLRMMKQCDR